MRADRKPSAFLLALVAIVAALSARPAFAAQNPVLGKVAHVWPTRLGQGYFPLWVELRNWTEKPQTVELTARCGMSDDETGARKSVELAAGEERDVELLVPIFDQDFRGWSWSGFHVAMRGAGWHEVLDTSSVERTSDAALRTVLVLGERLRDEATELAWSSALSTSTLTTWSASGAGTPNVEVASARFDEHVPSYAEAYSSLDIVLLDLSAATPSEEALGPLLRWTRLGGRLFVLGVEAESRARAIGALAPWMEERFRVDMALDATRAYRCGLGLLAVCAIDAPALEASEQLSAVRELLADPKLPASHYPPANYSPSHLVTIPGVGDLPYEVFLVLLLGFAIVIGPVNFVVLRKLGKPFLLLVTVPAISMLASLAIFVYGAFSQGFGAKAATHSLTILDQRAGWASTVEHRAAYYPLSPATGLRPEAGTSIYPVVVEDPRRFWVDLTQGMLLSNGFLPVRMQVDHVALSDRPASLRLRVSEGEGELVVHNELGVAIDRLILRDSRGGTYTSPDRIESGASAPLARDESLDEEPLASELLSHEFLEGRELAASTFVAELSDTPFLDDCGVEAEVLARDHVLYGVLPARQEEW